MGGFYAVIGVFASDVAALDLLAWFVGHWSFAVRHDVRYRSAIALWVKPQIVV
jgi:hypothetical protein